MKSRYLLPIVILLGVVLRITCSVNELWLDEIWSLQGAQGLRSPLHLLSDFRSDNNHPLTTLWFYLIGSTDQWWLYRLPSLLAGCISLWAIHLLMKPRGDVATAIAFILYGFSFLLVLYDSEARGYALLVPIALVSLLLLQSYEEKREGALAFTLVAAIGPLAHLLYVQFFTALTLYSVILVVRRRLEATDLLKLFTLPSFAILALYYLHVRYLPGGTGPLRSQLQTILDTASLTLGGPTISMYATDTAAVVLLLTGAAIALLIISIRSLANLNARFFYLLVIVGVPAIFLLASPRVIFPRYFILSVMSFYLLLAEFLQLLWSRGRGGRVTVILGMSAYLVGQSIHLWPLLKYGRGQYMEALQVIAKHSTVSGDHDGRNKTLVEFYRADPANITYISTTDKDLIETDWYLIHSQDEYCSPPQVLEKGENTYVLKRETGYGGQSGWRWFTYQKHQGQVSVPITSGKVCQETRSVTATRPKK